MHHFKRFCSAAAICLLVLAGCANQPPAAPPDAPPMPAAPTDVYLVPLGDFPFEAADQLARHLAADVKLHVRASLPMGIGDIRPLQKDAQLPADDIIQAAHQVGQRLPNTSDKLVVIALTNRDINDRAQSLRFLFAKNDLVRHTAVISVARMHATTPQAEGSPSQVGQRLYKMLKRTVGEQYFGLPRTSDLSDIMYAPIMSLEDIDAMGMDYKR